MPVGSSSSNAGPSAPAPGGKWVWQSVWNGRPWSRPNNAPASAPVGRDAPVTSKPPGSPPRKQRRKRGKQVVSQSVESPKRDGEVAPPPVAAGRQAAGRTTLQTDARGLAWDCAACGEQGNYASRTTCKNCFRLAPPDVLASARLAHASAAKLRLISDEPGELLAEPAEAMDAEEEPPKSQAAVQAEIQELQKLLVPLKSHLANIAGYDDAFRKALEKQAQDIESRIAKAEAPAQQRTTVSREHAELQVAWATNGWQLAMAHREALEADLLAITRKLERAREKEDAAKATREKHTLVRDELRRRDAEEASVAPAQAVGGSEAATDAKVAEQEREIATLRAKVLDLEAACVPTGQGDQHQFALRDGASGCSRAQPAGLPPGAKASAEQTALEIATKATAAFEAACRTAFAALEQQGTSQSDTENLLKQTVFREVQAAMLDHSGIALGDQGPDPKRGRS